MYRNITHIIILAIINVGFSEELVKAAKQADVKCEQL